MAAIILEASEETISQTGFCPQPQVHIFLEDMDAAYVGYVVSRRFYRGDDAASAIAALGVLPSVLMATRLIIAWEDSDLRTALELPGNGFATGMVLVDASFDRHVLRWHPFRAEAAPAGSAARARVTWATPARYENVPLLAPIEALLAVWREFRGDDLERTALELQQAGYEVNWASPIAGK
ncbi:hypothetical protein [Parafrankia sp. EUN1f]|uniref:hypothetical protein n=1 Tax=Parafrankia sp. EUN1f TaxID=102897 RepID=UPI00030FC679|nr:hypothetical protein [Parafrankia sp. EUN1f]